MSIDATRSSIDVNENDESFSQIKICVKTLIVTNMKMKFVIKRKNLSISSTFYENWQSEMIIDKLIRIVILIKVTWIIIVEILRVIRLSTLVIEIDKKVFLNWFLLLFVFFIEFIQYVNFTFETFFITLVKLFVLLTSLIF